MNYYYDQGEKRVSNQHRSIWKWCPYREHSGSDSPPPWSPTNDESDDMTEYKQNKMIIPAFVISGKGEATTSSSHAISSEKEAFAKTPNHAMTQSTNKSDVAK